VECIELADRNYMLLEEHTKETRLLENNFIVERVYTTTIMAILRTLY
jgi:hypothetical protein